MAKWVSGCTQELQFGSFDRSRQRNTRCAACGQVGRWLGRCLRRRTTSCRISEHAPEQEKRRYVCLVWLRVDRSHQRQLRGFTTEPLLRRKRARHSGRKAPFASPSASGRSDHDRFTGSTPDRVRDVSSRVPPLKSVSSLRSLPCAQQVLPSISVR